MNGHILIYLFDVITKEGEKKRIENIDLDPERLASHRPLEPEDFPRFGYQQTIESQNIKFREYLNELNKHYGNGPRYKYDLKLLNTATAIVMTAALRETSKSPAF
jgi:hypothetical protein